jgi:hypothetical protein
METRYLIDNNVLNTPFRVSILSRVPCCIDGTRFGYGCAGISSRN